MGSETKQEIKLPPQPDAFNSIEVQDDEGDWVPVDVFTLEQVLDFARAAVKADRALLTFTKTEAGELVAVTRTDDEGRILDVLWEAPPVRKPLAQEQIDYGFAAQKDGTPFQNGVRFAEQHHGIGIKEI